MRLLCGMCLLALVASAYAESPRFRTDADGPVKADEEKKTKGKSALPDWYRLVDGQFPPEGSAHAVSGELIAIDHLNRQFKIRVDRNDSQDRGVWDLPLHAAMLPYGAIYYHNAPAALQDIPLGTHLHGLFYLQDPDDKAALPDDGYYRRHTPEAHFRRCFQIEDDFSFNARQKQTWEINDVDLTAMKLTATLQQEGKPVGAAKVFDLLTSTKVLKGSGFADLKALAKGQQVLFDLTWVTLYGPGRVMEIWIDDDARQLATAQQLETHRNYIRQRGLPGWVTAVDDQQQIVTIVFFAGVDPKLFDELTAVTPPPTTAPTSPAPTPAPDPSTPSGAIAVARESLMTYDPVNDRKGGPVVEIKRIPIEPGSSGVQIKVKCDLMLEGFRPRRIVRFYPSTWKVIALPREEEFFGSE
ncbi:MAG TPA: hypothetical protein VLJ39_23160 [Tepidisphaeraceae bacterium]|nr:hypothetical protein [Tepidisphaeraceae bacterium]